MQVAKKHTINIYHWFTLLEIVIMIIVFSAGMVGVFAVLRQWVQFAERTRQDVIAINLAREWVESVINIRNTNRLRRAWRKDQCRLKQNPMRDESNEWCADDQRIVSGSYVLSEAMYGNQSYMTLEPRIQALNTSQGIRNSDREYSLCLTNKWRSACPGQAAITPEGQYFRSIDVKGLYAKDTSIPWGDPLICPDGLSNPICGNSTPKELRYCSRVEYQGKWFGQVNLCMILTNFQE